MPKIRMPEAWGEYTGSATVKVAVIDSGVSKYHNEISSILVSQGGWDYVDMDSNALDENISGHGTMIAGIIAAIRNNNAGISGVFSGARILPLRTADSDGNSNLGDTADAIERAVDNGCKVINLSFGGANLSSAQNLAISYANSKGVLVVCSAGNGGTDGVGDNNDITPNYPSDYNQANIISVANSTSGDILSTSSNYGITNVDIAAPGTDIYSTQGKVVS